MGTFKIIFSSGVIEHYPREGYIWVTVEQEGAT